MHVGQPWDAFDLSYWKGTIETKISEKFLFQGSEEQPDLVMSIIHV